MNVEIKPPIPIPIDERDIWVNGVVVGKIRGSNGISFKYQAMLNSEVDRGALYQGFGYTDDEAMRDAITRSRDRYKKQLAELDQLENLIWGDYETHE